MKFSYFNFINVIKHSAGCYEFVKSFSLIPSVISVSSVVNNLVKSEVEHLEKAARIAARKLRK